MTVNKTQKPKKTDKTAEALTTVGVRLSQRTVEFLKTDANARGRSLSDHVRSIIEIGIEGDEYAYCAIECDLSRQLMELSGKKDLSDAVADLVRIEVARIESRNKLAEYRKKISEYRIGEVGQ